jgi:hypothetical protein
MTRPPTRRHPRSGSALIEFALVLPLAALLVAGAADLGFYFTRALAAGDWCRQAGRLAAQGFDLTTPTAQERLRKTGAPFGWNDRQGCLRVFRLDRPAGRYRLQQVMALGDQSRPSPAAAAPTCIVELEADEFAWVVEVVMDSGAYATWLPREIHLRNVL